jgi:hypothetical protein
MNRQRFVLHTAAFSIAFLMFSASAWADLTGSVYRVAGNLQDATFVPAQNVIGTAATLDVPTLGDLNFTTAGNGGTLGDFLNAGVPPDTVTPVTPAWLTVLASGSSTGANSNCYGRTISNDGGDGCYSTEIELSGTVTLTAGTTYYLSHDDGVVLSVGVGSTTNVLVGPVGSNPSQDPTTDIANWFTWEGQTGTYTVNIGYMATNGNPEDLVETEKAGAVPEPSAVSMLVAMSVGVAGFAGILKKKLA